MHKIAFLFPGQGAQRVGMGKDFYENSPLAADLYDQASELLSLDLKALCFRENDRLNLTEYTQVALAVTCLAMERVVEAAGIRPLITAGLSLGEYCAICAAGGMSALDVARTVRLRGQLMQDTVPAGQGSMAAVLGMEASAIEGILEGQRQEKTGGAGQVWIANYNCPGQIVITGAAQAVAEASVRLKEGGARRVLPLQVSGPFHSPLLQSAGDRLMECLKEIPMEELKLPYVTNVTAEIITDIGRTRQLLRDQVASPVRWQQSVETMLKQGYDAFVEIGPGKTLAGFMRKIDKEAVVHNVASLEDVDKLAQKLC